MASKPRLINISPKRAVEKRMLEFPFPIYVRGVVSTHRQSERQRMGTERGHYGPMPHAHQIHPQNTTNWRRFIRKLRASIHRSIGFAIATIIQREGDPRATKRGFDALPELYFFIDLKGSDKLPTEALFGPKGVVSYRACYEHFPLGQEIFRTFPEVIEPGVPKKNLFKVRLRRSELEAIKRRGGLLPEAELHENLDHWLRQYVVYALPDRGSYANLHRDIEKLRSCPEEIKLKRARAGYIAEQAATLMEQKAFAEIEKYYQKAKKGAK